MNETIGPDDAIATGVVGALALIVEPSHDPFDRLGEGPKPLV